MVVMVMVVVAVVGYCSLVVVVLVTVFGRMAFEFFRRTIVRCTLCGCGCGIGDVVMMVRW